MMFVSEGDRQKVILSVFGQRDKNLQFLQLIQSYPPEKKCIDKDHIDNLVKKVLLKMKNCQLPQTVEWSQIIHKKIFLFHTNIQSIRSNCFNNQEEVNKLINFPSKVLRESLILLVRVCNFLQIEYESIQIEQMIKQFYFGVYKEQMLAYFCTVDYECTKFRVLPARKQPVLQCCNSSKEKAKQISFSQ